MLIVCANGKRHIRIDEDGQVAIWFWSDGCTLDVLIVSKAYVGRRVSEGFEQVRAGMFAQHPLAEGTVFFPFIPAILKTGYQLEEC